MADSRWIAKAEALKTYLEGVAGLESVPVLVDRQKDVAKTIELNVGKGSGVCITILWLGFTNPNRNRNSLEVGGDYAVRVFGKPVLLKDQEPIDNVAETVLEALQGWTEDADPKHPTRERCEVESCGLVPNAKYMIYELPISFGLV